MSAVIYFITIICCQPNLSYFYNYRRTRSYYLKNTKTKFCLNVDVYIETVVMLISIYFDTTDCWILYKYEDSWLNRHRIFDFFLATFYYLHRPNLHVSFDIFPNFIFSFSSFCTLLKWPVNLEFFFSYFSYINLYIVKCKRTVHCCYFLKEEFKKRLF